MDPNGQSHPQKNLPNIKVKIRVKMENQRSKGSVYVVRKVVNPTNGSISRKSFTGYFNSCVPEYSVLLRRYKNNKKKMIWVILL